TEGERQIPVTYARRMRGRNTLGGVNTHLPIRVTTAGVIPIIFAISLMLFPPLAARFLIVAANANVQAVGNAINRWFENNTFYSSAYFILVVLFTYFYTSIVFQPTQVAENLQKQGGFIPGVRPGTETARYLGFIVSRITLAGALFLGLIAVLPFMVKLATHTQTLVLGGTGLLIIVSVIIETMRQFRAQLVMRTYD
ncbi:MAG: SecY family transport protein, partial [Patescibacteria group bacterium]